ncbi:oxygen-independent coproporphyrinogen III oxidase [Ornithinibacillus massiliensis]|uniref:Heme chaperone HemW n=1 Tax=Ornithinibacillus massiliensis TaxID=1944633 RepID=A0ABS5MB26_9BACI|nr:radical SAM family heme chaperone HemW [Ornithinibacillus massiliensis]MBS3679529.1 oxygen-independent coproporphyrinogen III oxidase [Ornithinibacillus massiliensis]
MIQSVYIHIPFCQHICHYCDFTKFFYNEQLATEYLEALENEINTHIQGSKHSVKTIFIGGGTPTALTYSQLKKLLMFMEEKFDVWNCEEYTIEANPGDFDADKAKLLKEYGINRVSLGVQVFDDVMLAELGRAHRVKDVYKTVELLSTAGLTNISLDMIYSLPNQTPEHFEKTVTEALSFGLPHYSAYSLQIEPKTIFYNRYKKGQLHRPAQEEEVEMYDILQSKMRQGGLIQYEISNFAKSGFESKHNLTYWNNDYYYGFGAGASGYLPEKRTMNIRPLPAYIKQANEDGKPILKVETIGLKEQIEEEWFLGLRKLRGVHKKVFQDKFGFSYELLYQQQIEHLVQKGWLINDKETIHLSQQGLLFGNDVFEYFLLEDEDLEAIALTKKS